MGTTPFLGFKKMSPPCKRGVNLWSVGGSHQEKAQSCRCVMTQRHVTLTHSHKFYFGAGLACVLWTESETNQQ